MKSRLLRPDFIVALLAVVIGLNTMFVYIYQARIMSKQLHATVWPYIEVGIASGDAGFSVNVVNKGVGPATVKKAKLIINDKEYADNRYSVDSIVLKLLGKDVERDYSSVQSRVLASGETIKWVGVDPKYGPAIDSALKKNKIQISICYCSVFDDCWKIENNRLTACKDCN